MLHGRSKRGSALSAFLGLVMLLIIGGLCALGGYYLGAQQKSEQPLLPGQTRTSTTVTTTLDDKDLLSRSIPYSQQDLRDQFTKLKFAPLNRGDLAFEVVVPNNWTWQTVQVGEKDLAQSNTREVQLAEIESPGSSLAIMQVWFLQAPENVTLSQFADSYVRARSFKMVEKAAEVGNRMDMLISYDTAKQKDIQSRITAMKVGKNIMWLACCAPANEFTHWNKAFTLAANSFSPAGAPIAFQPDVPVKLAQGAILVNEVSDSNPSNAQRSSGIPGVNQPQRENPAASPAPAVRGTEPGTATDAAPTKPAPQGTTPPGRPPSTPAPGPGSTLR